MSRSEFFRPVDAKTTIGVSRATVYRWIKNGHLTPITHGSMTFISTKEASEHIKGLGG